MHPVNLLVSIDAFRKATPILHSLRLCNQFGQGKDVHINKLSKELIDFIEEEVLTIHRREEERLELGWAQRHHCFQGTCRPSEHLCPPKIYDAIVKVAYQDLCEEHPEWYHLEDGLETPENLDELLAKRINESRDQYYFGSTYDFCSDSRSEWLADVRKLVDLKGGNAVCDILNEMNAKLGIDFAIDGTKVLRLGHLHHAGKPRSGNHVLPQGLREAIL